MLQSCEQYDSPPTTPTQRECSYIYTHIYIYICVYTHTHIYIIYIYIHIYIYWEIDFPTDTIQSCERRTSPRPPPTQRECSYIYICKYTYLSFSHLDTPTDTIQSCERRTSPPPPPTQRECSYIYIYVYIYIVIIFSSRYSYRHDRHDLYICICIHIYHFLI